MSVGAGMADYLAAYAASGPSTAQLTKVSARIQRTYRLTAGTFSAFDGAAAATNQLGDVSCPRR